MKKTKRERPPCKINSISMAVLPKATCRLSALAIKIPVAFIKELEKKDKNKNNTKNK